ncbi:MAG: chromate resistance protein [Thermoprotei archaeon]
MKWVTREKAMVDRIACPWLIKKFIDADATFLFVPENQVMKVAEEKGAIPFDVKGAELSHYYGEDGSEYVTFDAIIKKYCLKDQALLELAKIVRGADAHKADNPPPESAGLKAAARGFREISVDDYDNMRIQFPLYDALYTYCKLKLTV